MIKNFYDLDVWKKARKTTLLIYECTKRFPKEELFGLTSQMRRAVVSIAANIAEGFGRISIKEKLNFYNQAYGSLIESQSHMFIASDLKYLSKETCQTIFTEMQNIQGLLLGLIRSTRKRL